MKGNRFFLSTGLLFLTCLLIFAACKKNKAFKEEDGQATVDLQAAQGQNDEAIRDVNIAIMDQSLLRGRSSSQLGTAICGLVIDTSAIYSGVIILNYNGSVCNNHKREGSIKVSIQGYPLKKWKQKGCVMKLEFLAYKTSRISDSKSVQLDGTEYITNENGKSWYDLYYMQEPYLIYGVIAEGLKVKFEGTNTALYNVSRRLTFTYAKPTVTCKAEGTGEHDGKTGVEVWGQTRDGNYFTSRITNPIIWNTHCGGAAPVEGLSVIKADGKDFELKCQYGVDGDGKSFAATDNQCAYGYKIEWSYKNNTKTRVFAY